MVTTATSHGPRPEVAQPVQRRSVVQQLLLRGTGILLIAYGTRIHAVRDAPAQYRTFRIYSFATAVTLIVLGVVRAPFGSRLAAGQLTPGFGILERISIYSSLLWAALLARALLRRRVGRSTP